MIPIWVRTHPVQTPPALICQSCWQESQEYNNKRLTCDFQRWTLLANEILTNHTEAEQMYYGFFFDTSAWFISWLLDCSLESAYLSSEMLHFMIKNNISTHRRKEGQTVNAVFLRVPISSHWLAVPEASLPSFTYIKDHNYKAILYPASSKCKYWFLADCRDLWI